MFIDFTQHALWMAVKLLAVSTDRSQEDLYIYIYKNKEIHTFKLKTQAHILCKHTHTHTHKYTRFVSDWKTFQGSAAHEKHHTYKKHLV